MMKIAFLMQCHKNPEQINLLLKALKHPQVDVYVHVDSKSESIREDIGEGDGIYLLPKKDSIDVQWGQFSQVQATLNLFLNLEGFFYVLFSGSYLSAHTKQTSLDKGTQRKTTENELPSLTQCTA